MPVVSLGAGNKAHGVHIMTSDFFHLYEEHTPRHSKIYTDLIPIIEDVYTRYMTDVRTRAYPGPEHTVVHDGEGARAIRRQGRLDQSADRCRGAARDGQAKARAIRRVTRGGNATRMEEPRVQIFVRSAGFRNKRAHAGG